MNKKYLCIKDNLLFETKGSTPKYVNKSLTIVLNQKCVRNGMVDYSFSQYISEQQNIADGKYVKIGDVLLNSTGQGTAGRCAFVDYIPENYKVTVDSHMLILRFENIELARFFAYSLYKQESYILELLTGSSGQGELDREIVYNISFPFDDKNLKIFNKILEAINNKIKLNNKINKELENLAKTLYDYWFVQFDFPDENKRPYKSSGGMLFFDEKYKTLIPIGWKIQNFNSNDLTEIIQPSIDKFENEKIYLPTANIQNDKIIDFSNKITYTNRESRANMQPISNSVWFAKMKNSKKLLYFSDYSKKYLNSLILSTGLCGLYCKNNSLEYIWNTVNREYFEIKKDSLAHGATQQAINNEDLISIPLLIPHQNIIEQYHNKVKAMYKQKYLNEVENIILTRLRDFLLPMLMNGQITIK